VVTSTQLADAGFIPDYTFLDASFKSQQGAGIDFSWPAHLTVRGSTFADGTGPAVNVNPPSLAEWIDLGSADGGPNTLQSASHLNSGGGVCLQVPGTLSAQGSAFAHCPPKSQPDLSCTGNTDIGY
jgi:hypothetical protein